jgi:hypothetical protein
LAGNALRHARSSFTVSLSLTDRDLLVAVTDASRHEPVLRSPGPSSTSGRGLQLVSALSSDWGVRLVHLEGKTVWATVPHLHGS